jgi:phage baseplate assembly protein W
MNGNTGRSLSNLDHLRQSITKILTTPVGSRIKRRPFGSLLPELVDYPTNDTTVIQLYAATATALLQNEPRLRLTRVQLAVNADEPGESTLEIDAIENVGGGRRAVSLSVPVFQGTAA